MDAGGILFNNRFQLPNHEEQEKITATAIINSYELMKYDAVGINDHDLAAGVDYLKQASRRTSFPWLSANLIKDSTNKPIFKPAITKTIDGVRFGIIGITNPKAIADKDDNLTIEPWEKVLPDLVQKTSNSCDFLILLSSLPNNENQRVAATIPGIHLILQSGPQNQSPQLVKNTLITGTGKKGKYLGHISINWQPSKRWGTGKSEQLRIARQNLDRIKWQLRRLRTRGLPQDGSKESLKILNEYNRLDEAHKQLSSEIKSLENSNEEDVSTQTTSFVALKINLPELPAVQSIIDKARKEVNEINKKLMPVAKRTSSFIGSHRCAECHPEQERKWLNTPHAKSYQTLVAQDQQFNLNCIHCHVTGSMPTNKREALSVGKEQQQVGCEACHGPSAKHVATKGKRSPPVPRPMAINCLRCHTPDHSDDFNFKRDSKLVH